MTENDTIKNSLSAKEVGGAFADGLTFIRIIMTPVIMVLIYCYWPDTKMAVFASILFIIAAVTDIFDDLFGGASKSIYRKYGWLDDIADTFLIIGTLIALSLVVHREGLLAWPFALPAAIIIGRELIVGLLKGFELSRFGWPDTKMSNAKSGLSMLAVCILVGSPWLTQLFDSYRAEQDPMAIFNAASPLVWWVGQGILCIAALLSTLTAIHIFKTPTPSDPAE